MFLLTAIYYYGQLNGARMDVLNHKPSNCRNWKDKEESLKRPTNLISISYYYYYLCGGQVALLKTT